MLLLLNYWGLNFRKVIDEIKSGTICVPIMIKYIHTSLSTTQGIFPVEKNEQLLDRKLGKNSYRHILTNNNTLEYTMRYGRVEISDSK